MNKFCRDFMSGFIPTVCIGFAFIIGQVIADYLWKEESKCEHEFDKFNGLICKKCGMVAD